MVLLIWTRTRTYNVKVVSENLPFYLAKSYFSHHSLKKILLTTRHMSCTINGEEEGKIGYLVALGVRTRGCPVDWILRFSPKCPLEFDF